MEDKTLTCKDCGKEFVFTKGEQEFYAEKGFTNEPTRCPECRRNRKQERSNSGRNFDRPSRY
ncbi:MAG: zinc-ribbon domain-containing protein [Bacilli bacterium]|jgi:ssDNA-binding Zn-finger/Zn-ribbon topoisomerase 1